MAINKSYRETAKTLCKVTMIIGYICLIIPGLLIQVLFYSHYKHAVNDSEPHMTLAICSIVFGGPLLIIAGILMLMSKSSK
jgi:amino acid transporter